MISIVIPIYNEEVLIEELLNRVLAVCKEIGSEYEIICVNDGSTDESIVKLLQFHRINKQIKVLSLSRNFGHQAALTGGLQRARGDYIVIMDGDLQDPPELIKDMYKKIKRDEYDIINGKRTGRREKWWKRTLILLFHSSFSQTSGLTDIDNVGNYAMLNRKALNNLLEITEKIRYLPGLRSFIGFRHGFVEYVREERFGGKSMSIIKLFTLGTDALFSFTKLPIKISLILGLIGILIFSVAGFYVIIAKIFGFAVLGWSSTLLSIYFIGSILLTFLGILGEYIYRIYKEVQNRPIYFVEDFFE